MLLHPHVTRALVNQHAHELEHAAAAALLARAAQRTSDRRRHAPAPAHRVPPRAPLARRTQGRRCTALA